MSDVHGRATSYSSATADPAAIAEILDRLSLAHYGLPLARLLLKVDTPRGRRQYARLIGVLVKEPFADAVSRSPSKSTGAVIGLRWKDDAELKRLAPGSWQFGLVRELSEERLGRKLSDQEALRELTYYKYESSLGRSIFDAFRRRICGDEKASTALKKAIAEAKKAGINLVDPTTTKLSVGLASVVAVSVSSLFPPALATVGAPVVGGIALLLIQVGVEGFCNWTKAAIEDAGDEGGQDN
jgi:hypothetical protein